MTLRRHDGNVMDGGRGPPFGEEIDMDLVEKALGEFLAGAPDLEMARAALSRETVIRQIMAETSEPRDIVTDMVDAARSMGEEAVLGLTDGEPTTLRDALSRYVEQLEGMGDVIANPDPGVIVDELNAILTYPWSQEEAVIALHDDNMSVKLEIGYPEDDEHVVIKVGGHEVARANHDEHGWEGMELSVSTAEAVHRAVLARVIADRDHHIQLSSAQVTELTMWLARVPRSGSVQIHDRLTVEAVEGGGILVRTRPYQYIPAPKTRV